MKKASPAECMATRWVVACAMLLLVPQSASIQLQAAEEEWSGLHSPEAVPLTKQIFRYRMDGKVRLLFFWVGKTGVGGGHVARIRSESTDGDSWVDGWEVLFGSDPDQVPGRHNRWGYARELAYWRKTNDETEASLERTRFEGFMSKSDEESLGAVRKADSGMIGAEEALFEGLVSLVNPRESWSAKRGFLSSGEANYGTPGPVGRRYEELMKTSPPDRETKFDNGSGRYQQPMGFLTAVGYLADRAVRNALLESESQPLQDLIVPYVNASRLYFLRIKKTKTHDRLEVAKDRVYSKVAEIDFELTREETGQKHSFELWIPTEGALEGIPLRIVDKPRWWLRVELNLSDSMRPEVVSVPPAPGSEGADVRHEQRIGEDGRTASNHR